MSKECAETSGGRKGLENLCLPSAGDDNNKRLLRCKKVLFEQWQHSRSREINDFLIKCFDALCQCLLTLRGWRGVKWSVINV